MPSFDKICRRKLFLQGNIARDASTMSRQSETLCKAMISKSVDLFNPEWLAIYSKTNFLLDICFTALGQWVSLSRTKSNAAENAEQFQNGIGNFIYSLTPISRKKKDLNLTFKYWIYIRTKKGKTFANRILCGLVRYFKSSLQITTLCASDIIDSLW